MAGMREYHMSENVQSRLDQGIAQELPAVTQLRHELHKHPQIAFEETFASQMIQDEFARLGIEYQAGIAETGVVGVIYPEDPDTACRNAIGLRADMDALAVTEETSLPYASTIPGRMHACGHDGHVAILLGAARVLSQMRDCLPRPVKLIFQPAEEIRGGGRVMVENNVLSEDVCGVKVDAVFALHGWPAYELGTFATRPGPMFGAPDMFTITVAGIGGHGALPHLTADPIAASAQMITAFQTIVSRNVNPTEPAVVSVGSIHAGDADNVIPQSVKMGGTIRSFSKGTAELLHRRVREIATQVAAAMNCRADVEIESGYPVTMNDPQATRYAADTIRQAVGDNGLVMMDAPVPVGEDFAYYGQQVPACLCLLGIRPKDESAFPDLHTPQFDFPDVAMENAIRWFCLLALNAEFNDNNSLSS